MAARLNNRHQDMVRAKIQTSQLINRLQNHALSDGDLTPTQLDSAKFLINKSLSNPPEQRDVNLSGNVNLSWPLPKSKLDL